MFCFIGNFLGVKCLNFWIYFESSHIFHIFIFYHFIFFTFCALINVYVRRYGIWWVLDNIISNHFELNLCRVTVNIHSPKKVLPSTYLLANKYSQVFSSQDKETPGSVYLPVNKYCFGKYLLPFLYSISIIGHNSHRFTPKPSLRQIKSIFSPKWISQ